MNMSNVYLRVAYELSVQVLVEHLNVSGVDGQERLLQIIDLKGKRDNEKQFS